MLVWDYSFNGNFLFCLDVLDIFNEPQVLDLFWVDTPAVFSAKQIAHLFILDEIKSIQHPCELVLGDERTFSSIEILQLVLYEDPFAGNHPFYITQELVENFLFRFIDSLGDLQAIKVSLCQIIVSELLVDVLDEVRIPDQISRRDSILISQVLDFCL